MGYTNKVAYAAQIFGSLADMIYVGNRLAAGTVGTGELVGTNFTPTTTTVTAPAVTSGAAFTPSAAGQNTMVYLTFALAGTLTSVTMGPTTGAENAVYGAAVLPVGGLALSLRVPPGWKVVVTTVTSTITASVVTC